MNQEWNIKSRSDACRQCNRPFAASESLVSALAFGAEGYMRGDYCEACWPSADREGLLSVWKSEYKMPEPPPDEPLKKETAESLLRQLMETEDPANLNVIYILAVMLERRRILAEKEVQVSPDGRMLRLYEHKKTGETFLIRDPGLKLAELESVQQEVVARLGIRPAAPAGAQNRPAEA